MSVRSEMVEVRGGDTVREAVQDDGQQSRVQSEMAVVLFS